MRTLSILRCARHEGPRHGRRGLHRLGRRHAAARRRPRGRRARRPLARARRRASRRAPSTSPSSLLDPAALARAARRRRRRRAALRRALARRRVGRAPRALLAQQRRRHAATCSTRCAPRGVGRLVFSSTCATYGEPERVPIAEDEPTAPVNAYGASKLAVDLMMRDECRRARARRGLAALLQRRGRERRAGRGPRARDAPDPARPPGRRRRARPHQGVRHGLPDARRHRGARLHPRRGPRRGAPARARPAASPARTASSTSARGDGYTVREVIEAARRVTGREIPVREEGAPRRATRRSSSPPTRARARSSAGRPRARPRRDDRRRLGLAPGAPATATRLTAEAAARRAATRRRRRPSAAAARVDHREALRLGGGERVVGGGDRGEEAELLALEPVGRLAAAARRARARRAGSIRSSSVRSGTRPPVANALSCADRRRRPSPRPAPW